MISWIVKRAAKHYQASNRRIAEDGVVGFKLIVSINLQCCKDCTEKSDAFKVDLPSGCVILLSSVKPQATGSLAGY